MTIRNIKANEKARINELLDSIKEIEPEEVMVLYMKDGFYHSKSNGTFSRIRTIGAIEALKYELLSTDHPDSV